jgi:hypothetical protein
MFLLPRAFPRFQHRLTEWCESKVKVFYTRSLRRSFKSLKSDKRFRGTGFAQFAAGAAFHSMPFSAKSFRALMEPAEEAIRE